jgi:DNA-binding transcriptional ArsR family regulator
MAARTSKKKTADASMGAKMQAQAEQAAELLKALSNPQRLRVMCLLIDGERTVGEINAEIELSQSALSQHLAVLREGGWVKTRRESQSVYYSVADGPVHMVIQTLHDIYCPTPDSNHQDGLC